MIYPPKLLADVIDFLESTPSAVTKHVSTGILICKTEPDFILFLYYIDADNEFSFLVTTDENQKRNVAGFVSRSVIGKIIFIRLARSLQKRPFTCIELCWRKKNCIFEVTGTVSLICHAVCLLYHYWMSEFINMARINMWLSRYWMDICTRSCIYLSPSLFCV